MPFLFFAFLAFKAGLASFSANLINSGYFFALIVSSVITTLLIFSSEGTSNITSIIISSIIALNPLAPVFLSIAFSAIALKHLL